MTSGRKLAWLRRIVGGSVAVATVIAASVILVPVAAAEAAEPPVAVDVDLVDGGVWVTYSNGCIESRAWQVPVDDDGAWYRAYGNRQCVVGKRLNGPDNLFHYPRVIRAPLSLTDGERVVALVPTDGGSGYWLITTAGRVVTGGSARLLGDLSAYVLNAPVVAAAPTESGNGYYMLTGDGGVFSFGDAVFYGSVQGLVDQHVGFGALAADHITAPVVTLATTAAGYWLVAADGTVFPFGDAAYHGSIQDAINRNNQLAGVTRDWVLRPNVAEGTLPAREALSAEVIGVVPSGGGTGYQMVAADGGIFNFGVSAFHGSLAGHGDSPAVASDVTASRSGYVILTEEGTVYRFGVVGRQLDPVGQVATALTPTALPAFECRPPGIQGFPFRRYQPPPIGALDVGVLFVEFDNYQADRRLWPTSALAEQLKTAEQYIEAMSYGQFEVNIHANYDWTSVGLLDSSFLRERTWGATGLGTSELLQVIVDRSTGSFDFSRNGLGYDAIMVVFPPTYFWGGLAQTGLSSTAGGVTVDAVAWTNTNGPRDERRTYRNDWWSLAAHEIMHLPGLDDLYPYDRTRHQAPDGWRTTEYGLMGFRTFWPAQSLRHQRSGRIMLRGGRTFFGEFYSFPHQEALEMLAWHRWRLGWLQSSQMECLAFGDGTVELAPIAAPGDDTAMAVVKLTDTEFLVMERRERIGFDADDQGTYSNTGNPYYYRVLDDEGVLAYVVDMTIGSGQLPVRVFAESAELRRGQNWILEAGDSASTSLDDGRTIHLDVSDGPDGTSRVQITTT